MSKRKRYTIAQVIEAIKGTGGIKTLIARKLGCDRATVKIYIDRSRKIKQA